MHLYEYIPILEDITISNLGIEENENFKFIYEKTDEKKEYISRYFCFISSNRIKILLEAYVEQCGNQFYLNFDFKLIPYKTWIKDCDIGYYTDVSEQLEYLYKKFEHYFEQHLNEFQLQKLNLKFTNYFMEKVKQIKQMTKEEILSKKKIVEKEMKNENQVIEKVVSVFNKTKKQKEEQLHHLSEQVLKQSQINFFKEQIEKALKEKDKEAFLKYSNKLNEITNMK